MNEHPDIVYRINALDTIVFVNEEWDRFAAGNGSPGMVSDRILNRSLWEFISDPTTRLLYREILERARAGRSVNFPFRCDSPDRRRFLEMTVGLTDDAAVQFRVRTVAVEQRASQPLIAGGGRVEPHLRMCGWCKKIPLADRGGWVEIEDAVAALKLFEQPELPLISHGICEDCETKMKERIGRT